MNSIVSFRTRTLLVQSFQSVEAAKDRIRLALSTSLARSERDPELSDTPDLIAAVLLSFLLEQVKHVIETGKPSRLAVHRAEHQQHDIDGRHYSRFGDVLVPVLRDILASSQSRAVASAWSDAFWAVLQRMRQGHKPGQSPQVAPQGVEAMA